MKNINLFKQLFNWVQSAPVDFCYVTGEWSFQGKTIATPALSSNALQSANNRRSLDAIRTPAAAAAHVGTPAATSVPVTAAGDNPDSRAA